MDLEKISKLGEGTTVSMGLVAIMICAATYVASAVGKTDSLITRLDKVEANQQEYNASVNEIKGELKSIDELIRRKRRE